MIFAIHDMNQPWCMVILITSSVQSLIESSVYMCVCVCVCVCVLLGIGQEGGCRVNIDNRVLKAVQKNNIDDLQSLKYF